MYSQMQTRTEEKVGRTYPRNTFEVHFRRAGGDKWLSFLGSCKTLEEARKAIDSAGQRYVRAGSVTIDLGEPSNLCEYRIVRVIASCEIVHVEIKKI